MGRKRLKGRTQALLREVASRRRLIAANHQQFKVERRGERSGALNCPSVFALYDSIYRYFKGLSQIIREYPL